MLAFVAYLASAISLFAFGLVRRGFSAWSALSWVYGALAVSVLAALAYYYLQGISTNGDRWGSLGRSDDIHTIAETIVAGIVALTIALAAVWLALPRRTPRIEGDRVVRFPLRGAAFSLAALLITVGVVLVTLALKHGPEFRNALWTAILCFLGAILVAIKGTALHYQRGSARSLHEVLSEDERAPVLYLRAFKSEELPFAIGRAKGLFQLLHPTYSSRLHVPSLWFRGGSLSLELFLSRAIERDLGPFVALGNPEDHLQPLGSVRMYPGDDRWQSAFDDLSGRAQAILLVAGLSDQVSWEMAHLLKHGMASKLFVISGGDIATESGWSSFRARASAVGYELPRQLPPLGSLFAFDSYGRSLFLTTAAQGPDELVAAIRRRLEQWRLQGGPSALRDRHQPL